MKTILFISELLLLLKTVVLAMGTASRLIFSSKISILNSCNF
jgi:hypothetical protein